MTDMTVKEKGMNNKQRAKMIVAACSISEAKVSDLLEEVERALDVSFLAGIEHEREAAKRLVEVLEKISKQDYGVRSPEKEIAFQAIAAYKARTEEKHG